MLDVLIVGAGPAGAVAGTILARAGARVRIVDRARFPRDKLCGDTVNPGTLARLEALDLAAGIDERSLRIDGMKVTGAGGVTIEGRYPAGLSGRAIVRRDFDWLLLRQAIAAARRDRLRRPASVSTEGPGDDRRGWPSFDNRVRPRSRQSSAKSPAVGHRRLFREFHAKRGQTRIRP